MIVLSHPAFAKLHPTPNHPESQERLAVLLEAFEFDEVEPAPVEAVLRCHTKEYVDRVRSVGEPTWLDGDTFASETSFDVWFTSIPDEVRAMLAKNTRD